MPKSANVAALFHAEAIRILGTLHRHQTSAEVARILDQNASSYRRYVAGGADLTMGKLQRWLQAWSDADLPAINVTMGPGQTRAVAEASQ